MLLATVVAAMGVAGAPLSARAAPAARCDAGPGCCPAIFWTALAAGVLLKGPVIVMVVVLAVGALAIVDRSVRWLCGAAADRRHRLVCAAGAAVVPRHRAARRRDLLRRIDRVATCSPRCATGQESHGAPPGYYLLLFWVTFWPGAMLAGLATPAICRGAARARREISAGLAGADLDRARARRHQAAALRAAALSGGRDPDRRHRRCTHAVGAHLARARHDVVVRDPARWPALPAIVALIVIGRQFGLLVWPVIGAAAVMGLLAWQLYESDGAEQSLLRGAAARRPDRRLPLFGLDRSRDHATVSERDAGKRSCARAAAASRSRPLSATMSRASSSSPAPTTRLTDGAGRRRFPARRRLPLRLHRGAPGAQLRAARRGASGCVMSPQSRIDAFNVSSGHAITIAVYRSGGPP